MTMGERRRRRRGEERGGDGSDWPQDTPRACTTVHQLQFRLRSTIAGLCVVVLGLRSLSPRSPLSRLVTSVPRPSVGPWMLRAWRREQWERSVGAHEQRVEATNDSDVRGASTCDDGTRANQERCAAIENFETSLRTEYAYTCVRRIRDHGGGCYPSGERWEMPHMLC